MMVSIFKKLRFVVYAVLAILFQIWLGEYTGKGQGGIAMLVFTILVEIDPEFSFAYLFSKLDHRKDK